MLLREHPEGLSSLDISNILATARVKVSPRLKPLELAGYVLRMEKRKMPNERGEMVNQTPWTATRPTPVQLELELAP